MQDPKVALLNNIFELNDMENKTPWYVSSANPEQLSLTITGMLMMYVPAVIAIAQFFNYTVDQSTLANIIGLISFAIAGLMVIGGFLRKCYYWFEAKNTK